MTCCHDGSAYLPFQLSRIHGQPISGGFGALANSSTAVAQQQTSDDLVLPLGNTTSQAVLNVPVSSMSLLTITITRTDNGRLIPNFLKPPVGSTGNLIRFSLTQFAPRTQPYGISIKAQIAGQTFTAAAQLYRLPTRTDGGSVTKIDQLYGTILVRASATLNGLFSNSSISLNSSGPFPNQNSAWTPFLPYSFYVGGPWMREPNSLPSFVSKGYNVLHIIPAGGIGYDFDELMGWLEEAESLGLWIMYDMRHTYKTPADVKMQVNLIKTRKNLLLWYTGDEPGMTFTIFSAAELTLG